MTLTKEQLEKRIRENQTWNLKRNAPAVKTLIKFIHENSDYEVRESETGLEIGDGQNVYKHDRAEPNYKLCAWITENILEKG